MTNWCEKLYAHTLPVICYLSLAARCHPERSEGSPVKHGVNGIGTHEPSCPAAQRSQANKRRNEILRSAQDDKLVRETFRLHISCNLLFAISGHCHPERSEGSPVKHGVNGIGIHEPTCHVAQRSQANKRKTEILRLAQDDKLVREAFRSRTSCNLLFAISAPCHPERSEGSPVKHGVNGISTHEPSCPVTQRS